MHTENTEEIRRAVRERYGKIAQGEPVAVGPQKPGGARDRSRLSVSPVLGSGRGVGSPCDHRGGQP